MFIVMELVKGGELYKNIFGRPILKEEEAYRIIKPLTECLAYMHRMGIIHRDIKVWSFYMKIGLKNMDNYG